MKKFKVYTHSKENGVYQVGTTVYQSNYINGTPAFKQWKSTMSECTKNNMNIVEAETSEDAIVKVIVEEHTKV